MDKDNQLREMRQEFVWDRPRQNTAPPLEQKDRHRTKLFKSGNSLAVRIPAGTKLTAGMEMELTIENGLILSYVPADMPKRKFNIDKIWGAGKATGLQYIRDEDRIFEERPLLWDDPAWRAKPTPDA